MSVRSITPDMFNTFYCSIYRKRILEAPSIVLNEFVACIGAKDIYGSLQQLHLSNPVKHQFSSVEPFKRTYNTQIFLLLNVRFVLITRCNVAFVRECNVAFVLRCASRSRHIIIDELFSSCCYCYCSQHDQTTSTASFRYSRPPKTDSFLTILL